MVRSFEKGGARSPANSDARFLNAISDSRLACLTRAARLVWDRDRLRQHHDHPDFSNLEAVTGYDGAACAPRKNGVN
jgi:hypothetical protein